VLRVSWVESDNREGLKMVNLASRFERNWKCLGNNVPSGFWTLGIDNKAVALDALKARS